jgi:hypothetical protein
LNCQIEVDYARLADLRELIGQILPYANESAQYPNQDDIDHHRTYSRLVFLPGTSDASPTLLIAGTTAQATQAAGKFFIRMNNLVGGAFLPEVAAWRTKKMPG